MSGSTHLTSENYFSLKAFTTVVVIVFLHYYKKECILIKVFPTIDMLLKTCQKT